MIFIYKIKLDKSLRRNQIEIRKKQEQYELKKSYFAIKILKSYFHVHELYMIKNPLSNNLSLLYLHMYIHCMSTFS